MGTYLNSKTSYTICRRILESQYYVDKTLMLSEVFTRINTFENYICITRPRRFGKSMMAQLMACFFSKGFDSREIFDKLKIADNDCYQSNINQHNVIAISFNEIPEQCDSYSQYISRIIRRLRKDLIQTYPDVEIDADDAIWDVLLEIYETYQEQFIFILDEWDFIFHSNFVTEGDKQQYISFMSNLLKDKPYVSLAYMTGILPISKYSSGSELNMFAEYTMASEEMYSEYFGFLESEVDDLYARFLKNQQNPQVTREGLRTWYDGYHIKSGERVYNPRSVVLSLTNNNLGNYWTSSGPYDEIYYYVKHNVAEVRDDLAQMVAGIPVSAKIQEYAATSMELITKNEIFSAMVVYGFLSYDSGYVSIPNKELMGKFGDMLMKESSLGYVHQLALESTKMLKATLNCDADKVAEIMKRAHDTETPLLSYNSESEMTVLVTLVYLAARDSYRVEREDKAGTGYVDFIFYPEIDRSADGFIIELKVDSTADDALRQIKDRNYALKFEGKLGEKPFYTGRVLGVGIAYDRRSKEHTCKIEVIRG